MGNKLWIIARIKAGLLLGGLGYGLAEGTFAPMDWAVRSLAAVSPAFRDLIYREATKGFDLMHSAANLTIRALMVVAIGYFSLWSVNYLLKRFTNWESSLILFQFARRNIIFNVFAVAIILASLMVNMQLNYSKQVMTYSMDSIEVLAPENPNATRLRLRLDFFCIRDAKDFYLLNDKLHKLSESTGTTLPDFKPV
jgi:hypothetical protein